MRLEAPGGPRKPPENLVGGRRTFLQAPGGPRRPCRRLQEAPVGRRRLQETREISGGSGAMQRPLLGEAPPQVDLEHIVGVRLATSVMQRPLLCEAPPHDDAQPDAQPDSQPDA